MVAGKIIKLNRRHIPQLVQVNYESEHHGDKVNKISRNDMNKELIKRFQGNELFFGYKLNNEIAGYATLKPEFPGHKHCELYWLAVKKKYQGQGIGTVLVKFIEDYAKKKGFRAIYVYTGKTMKKTIEFYLKNKYKKINEFPEYYGYSKGNTTAVLFGKQLR